MRLPEEEARRRRQDEQGQTNLRSGRPGKEDLHRSQRRHLRLRDGEGHRQHACPRGTTCCLSRKLRETANQLPAHPARHRVGPGGGTHGGRL